MTATRNECGESRMAVVPSLPVVPIAARNSGASFGAWCRPASGDHLLKVVAGEDLARLASLSGTWSLRRS